MQASYIGTRIDSHVKELVAEVARSRGTDLSGFLRFLMLRELAVLGLLSDKDVRALGIIEGYSQPIFRAGRATTPPRNKTGWKVSN